MGKLENFAVIKCLVKKEYVIV